VVIATPWPEFAGLDPAALKRRQPGRVVVVDCWRILDSDRYADVADVVLTGKGRSGA
jgi:hypothetical protein